MYVMFLWTKVYGLRARLGHKNPGGTLLIDIELFLFVFGSFSHLIRVKQGEKCMHEISPNAVIAKGRNRGKTPNAIVA